MDSACWRACRASDTAMASDALESSAPGEPGGDAVASSAPLVTGDGERSARILRPCAPLIREPGLAYSAAVAGGALASSEMAGAVVESSAGTVVPPCADVVVAPRGCNVSFGLGRSTLWLARSPPGLSLPAVLAVNSCIIRRKSWTCSSMTHRMASNCDASIANCDSARGKNCDLERDSATRAVQFERKTAIVRELRK